MDELVSIIVPVYNVESFLNECIDSILNQTYRNIEVILVNDGSKDHSGRICDGYAKKDHRIVVIHKENGGLSDARNVGLDKATGDWILFVDSDDYIDCDMVGSMLKIAVLTDSDMIICGINILDPLGTKKHQFFESEVVSCDKRKLMDAKNGFWSTSWNRLCKAKLYDGIRFPVGKIHEDEAITYRLIDRCNKINGTSNCYYYYRIRSGSIMTNPQIIYNLDLTDIFYEKYQFFIQKKEYDLAEAAFQEYMNEVLIAYGNLHKMRHPSRKIVLCKMKKAYLDIRTLDCALILKIKWLLYCYVPFIYLLRNTLISNKGITYDKNMQKDNKNSSIN